MKKLKPWWWLSFCDPDKPIGSRFLGVALVRARDSVEATKIAWALKINPGGQIASWQMPQDYSVPDEFKNRLLSREDIIALQGSATTIGEFINGMKGINQ